MVPTVHHECSLELDHDGAVLVESNRLDGHDTDVGPRLRFAGAQHLALRVDRIAFKDRRRQTDLIPAEVGHYVEPEIDDRLSGHKRERKRRIDEWLSELCLGRVGPVEVDRVVVLCQQCEPNVVGVDDCASDRMAVDVTDLEILVDPTGPSFFDRHVCSLCVSDHSGRTPFGDGRRIVAELGQYRIGMLPDRRYRVHPGLDPFYQSGRQERLERSSR